MNFLHQSKESFGGVVRPFSAGASKLMCQRLLAREAPEVSLSSAGFNQGGKIPRIYSGEGENLSPPLLWEAGPAETKEWVLICEDPDAPRLEPFIHWIISKIPPEVVALPEGVPCVREPESTFGAIQSYNGKGLLGYTGPFPPSGHGIHNYHFQLFAIDKRLMAGQDLSLEELVTNMRGHVVAKGNLVGTYERN